MRLLLLAAMALVFAAPAWGNTVYVQNESSIPDIELVAALPAFQAQLDHDLEPAWHVRADLQLGPVPAGAWGIHLVDELPACWCYGYHDVVAGAPVAYVGTDEWQLTFSHELLEMEVDPWTTTFAKVGRRFYLIEVGDPVEDDTYTRPGADGKPVILSDFATPAWYRPGHAGPFDFLGLAHRQLELRPGGYVSWWDGRWYQRFNWRRLPAAH